MPPIIKLLTTGGTIDCESVDEISKEYSFAESYIPKMVQQSRITVQVDVEHVMSKDSLLMTDVDRELILQKCISCNHDKIIITHGTDTLAETAVYLGEKVKNKTIVLVGAIIPYNKESSDALFNLGTAVASVQLLPYGVYISMNGRVFTWNNVKKNKELGIFEMIY